MAVVGSLTAGEIAFNATSTICRTPNSTSCCNVLVGPQSKAASSSAVPSGVRRLPDLSTRRRFDVDLALSVLDQVSLTVEPVDRSLYEDYQEIARARVLPRDPDDWPVAAVALLLGIPIWTEDQDFFGSGIATWTTDRVELFLREL